jgi:hypothetical protein
MKYDGQPAVDADTDDTKATTAAYATSLNAWLESSIDPGDVNVTYLRRQEPTMNIDNNADNDINNSNQENAMTRRKAAAKRTSKPRTKQAKVQSKRQQPQTVTQRDSRLPDPGAVITRTYQGRELSITVGDTDFEFEGRRYKSISAIGMEITGKSCNGYLFFGLNKQRQE